MPTVNDLLQQPEWDAPFFKKLANNDTAAGRGKQAGMVLPMELRPYLPSLNQSEIDADNPTTDRSLAVEMFIEAVFQKEDSVRYQFQTWGGTRTPESRLTDGLQPLHSNSRGGDILILQRRLDSFERFRFILVRQGTPEFAEIDILTNGRRWGPLLANRQPVSISDVTEAAREIDQIIIEPFRLRRDVQRIETRQLRIARRAVFRVRVSAQYQQRCSISGISIITPTGLSEIEAAHVVPVSEGGGDDVRNGLALCRTIHWAFDHGLLGISPDRRVFIPETVRRMPENRYLAEFHNRPLTEGVHQNSRVHNDALVWHMENRVARWL